MSSDATTSGLGWRDGCCALGLATAPLLVCDRTGNVVDATPAAMELIGRFGDLLDARPRKLSGGLWSSLRAAPHGEPIEWRPPEQDSDRCLGCTKYRLGSQHLLLLMRELSRKNRAMSKRLHLNRLEVTGRLVAMMAHDLRAPLATILLNSTFLANDQHDPPDRVALQQCAQEIAAGARRLRQTVDSLLALARLGPPVALDTELAPIFGRLAGSVRPLLRSGKHQLSIDVGLGAEWVVGNPLAIEQILLSLLTNAAQTKPREVQIELTARRLGEGQGPAAGSWVRVDVRDDGPGIAESLRQRVFEPFFTTKESGNGIGLTMAREAARELGGELTVSPGGKGACLSLYLLASSQPDQAGR